MIFRHALRCTAFIDELVSWDRILQHLVEVTRKNAGKEENPTYAVIDSQSVKTTYASDQRGFDGGKKRKAESDK